MPIFIRNFMEPIIVKRQNLVYIYFDDFFTVFCYQFATNYLLELIIQVSETNILIILY